MRGLTIRSVIPSDSTGFSTSSRVGAKRLKFALDLFDRHAEGGIVGHSPLDQVERVDDGGVVAAERLSDYRKRASGHLAAQVHRNLSAECDVLSALFGFQIGQSNMEELG